MKKLVIVESPGKVSKIQGYLGPDYKVMASVGHVRDLPQKEMGVDFTSFKPQYVPTDRGQGILAKLKAAVNDADDVFLATDPDREGEAIAWHLADSLGLRDAKRITYTSITEKAIKTALDSPRPIDANLVAAQEGRRVLDRLVGFQVSPALCRRLGGRQSSGRVQSPAVRIVVDRDQDIRDFKVTNHYGVDLTFERVDNVTDGWKASWVVKPWLEAGQEYFLDKAIADQVAKQRTLDVLDCQESEGKAAPPAPFITSSLQQAASNALKYKPKRTMELAQRLYEDGHISYMRTDSPNLSDEAFDDIRNFCLEHELPVVSKKRTWKSKAGAQEAHEAIRPNYVAVEEAGNNDEEKALYRLIRLRTLASQLEDAVFAVRNVQLSGELVNGKETLFSATGRTLVSKGWKVVMETDQADADDTGQSEPDNPVPVLHPGSKINVAEGKVVPKKTKPPKRYDEASLIRELERLGIGRPSTYAAIMDNITAREYIKNDSKGFLIPTPEGVAIVVALKPEFSFMSYDFTKILEDSLDDIAQGKANYKSLMQATQAQLEQELKHFSGAVKSCEDCGSALRRVKGVGEKNSQPYDFWGCSSKDCPATYYTNENELPGAKKVPKDKPILSEHKCAKCGKPLIHRQGAKKDGSGDYDFWSCSGYPKCNASYPDDGGKPGEHQKK